MTNKRNVLMFMCDVFLVVFVCLAVASDKQPVASVNGKIITQEDINDYVLKVKPSQGKLTNDTKALLQMKQVALDKLVFKQFYDELLESENVLVSDKELDEKFDEMLSVLPKESVEEMKRMVNAVRKALDAWHANPADEKQIYKTHLTGIMSYADWGAYQDSYNSLKGAEKEGGWREYFKLMSLRGLTKQIAWEKLKKKVTKQVVVEEVEVRKEYERNYPRSEYWDVLHFYHLDEDQIRQAVKALSQNTERQKIQSVFHRFPKETGGIFKERIFNREYLPFYAGRIRELKKGEVGPITFGVLVSNQNKGLESKTAKQYYHLLYVERIGKTAKALPFEKVRTDIEKKLLKVKEETVWQDWLMKQYKKSDIKVMDKRFKVPEFSDQYKSISVIVPAEEKADKVTSPQNKRDEEVLPPPEAVRQ